MITVRRVRGANGWSGRPAGSTTSAFPSWTDLSSSSRCSWSCVCPATSPVRSAGGVASRRWRSSPIASPSLAWSAWRRSEMKVSPQVSAMRWASRGFPAVTVISPMFESPTCFALTRSSSCWTSVSRLSWRMTFLATLSEPRRVTLVVISEPAVELAWGFSNTGTPATCWAIVVSRNSTCSDVL